jgi:hypothetical protein
MQEPEQREISGLDVNQIPPTSARDGRALMARSGHGSDVSGESMSDLFRENVDHLGSCFLGIADLIYSLTPSSESDSDNGREVFTLG